MLQTETETQEEEMDALRRYFAAIINDFTLQGEVELDHLVQTVRDWMKRGGYWCEHKGGMVEVDEYVEMKYCPNCMKIQR